MGSNATDARLQDDVRAPGITMGAAESPLEGDCRIRVVQRHLEVTEKIRDAQQGREIVMVQALEESPAALPHDIARSRWMEKFEYKGVFPCRKVPALDAAGYIRENAIRGQAVPREAGKRRREKTSVGACVDKTVPHKRNVIDRVNKPYWQVRSSRTVGRRIERVCVAPSGHDSRLEDVSLSAHRDEHH